MPHKWHLTFTMEFSKAGIKTQNICSAFLEKKSHFNADFVMRDLLEVLTSIH